MPPPKPLPGGYQPYQPATHKHHRAGFRHGAICHTVSETFNTQTLPVEGLTVNNAPNPASVPEPSTLLLLIKCKNLVMLLRL